MSVKPFEGSRRSKDIDASFIGAYWCCYLSWVDFLWGESGHDPGLIPWIHASVLITGGLLLFFLLALLLRRVRRDGNAMTELAFPNAAAMMTTKKRKPFLEL